MVTVFLTKIGNWAKLGITYRYNRYSDFQETTAMDSLQQAMYDFVVSSGGSATWQELIDAMPPEERARIPRAFAQMKAAGLLTRQSAYSPETGLSPLMVKVV